MIHPDTKAKILWNCRRGMLELDLILSRFVKNGLEQLDDQQLRHFEKLLQHQDPDLYAWFMGYEQTEDKDLSAIIEHICHKNRPENIG